MKSKLLLCMAILLAVALTLIAAAPEKKNDPNDAARLNNLGCAYMNQQLFEKALKYFEDAASADPNLHVAKLNEGIALLNLARVDAAKKILDGAAEVNSNDPPVWYALGMLEKNSSDPQAAVEDFKRVIAIDDRDAYTWYFLGTAYSQLKQFPQAIDAFEHALKLNPLHASAQFGLSRAYQQSGDTAHAREHLARFQYVTQNHLGAAMSLAYGEQGKYSLAEESQAATARVPPQIPVQFVDVTKEAGLLSKPSESADLNSYWGHGACFIDYDNDGRIDLFLAESGAEGGISLYHNLGDGHFEDVTRKARLNPDLHMIGCTSGDYDNDGWADIAVTGTYDVLLFQNQKNGTFKELASQAGIGAHGLNVGVTFVDYDHDGDLDLLVTRSGDKAEWGHMYRNNGNGTFTNVTDELVPDRGPSGGAGAIGLDYNNDRAVDLLLPGLVESDLLPTILENPREGKFRVRKPWASGLKGMMRGAGVLEFAHDGWMDVAFAHDGNEESVSLWRNDKGKKLERIDFPKSP